MSLFEWLGESHNPGNVGSVDVGGRDRSRRSRISVLACFLISVAVLGLWGYSLWNGFGLRSLSGIGIASGATLIYLAFAYSVHPQPDMKNVGWLGGLVDHPFRYSDDINRFLIFLVVILWPGRFLTESLVDSLRLFRHAREHGPRSG